MSGKAVGRNAILPFRPRQLPEIDTIWVDVSTILCLPAGYMAGIPRTIRKLLDCLSTESWVNVRLCVVVPDVGLAEVHPNCIEEHDLPLNPFPHPLRLRKQRDAITRGSGTSRGPFGTDSEPPKRASGIFGLTQMPRHRRR